MEHSTLNIGVIRGGSAPNIIADEVQMGVMLRNLSKESRETMCGRIEKLAAGIAESMAEAVTVHSAPDILRSTMTSSLPILWNRL